ncbi:MAG: STAS domain-containing protein [Acidimicrobiales bacterium]
MRECDPAVPARRGGGTTVGGVQIVTHAHQAGTWSVVTVSGELDVVGGPDLRQEVMAAVRDGRRRLILDLTGVDFVDSFGLGVVIGALKRVRLLDGDLRLVVGEPRVRRVFEVCDLDRVFVLHHSVDEAIEAAA